jgi:hypothetical protein
MTGYNISKKLVAFFNPYDLIKLLQTFGKHHYLCSNNKNYRGLITANI